MTERSTSKDTTDHGADIKRLYDLLGVKQGDTASEEAFIQRRQWIAKKHASAEKVSETIRAHLWGWIMGVLLATGVGKLTEYLLGHINWGK